jgi:hypothetical protein
MNTKTRSTITFFILVVLLVAASALNTFLPQGKIGTLMPESQIPKWQMALAGAGINGVAYGLLGFLGLLLWRKDLG